jgi:hypothetical protein
MIADADESIAEYVLKPEPFPHAAELVLSQYVLLRELLKEAPDARAST